MRCLLVGLSLALLFSVPAAWAQSSLGGNDDTGPALAERRPSENVSGGAVRERAPGRIINAARARHRELRDARLAAQRTGDTAALAPEPGEAAALGSTLSDLLTGSFGSLISTFLNTGLGGAINQPGTLPPPGGGGNIAGPASGGSDFSNLPPEVIQMLQGAGISLSDLTQRPREDPAEADAAQPKILSRAQTTTSQEEPKFIVRWADAMLSTFFTALTVGFQTPDFINLVTDFLRPIFIPQGTDADGADGTTTDDGTGSDGDAGDGDGADGTTSNGEEPLI